MRTGMEYPLEKVCDEGRKQYGKIIHHHYKGNLDATRQQYMRELESKDKQYRDILTDKNRWLRRMFFCLIGMLAVISFLLIVDFINPTIGVFHP